MEQAALEKKSLSCYSGDCFVLATKHAKSIAIAPIFSEKLEASVVEYTLDTDQLGTFSGEVKRQGTALECAQKKCELALEILGDKVEYVLASEGSFGPHPYIPFLQCDHEILYLIDRKHDFHLHVSHMSEKTNYNAKEINSLEELKAFAEKALFPSHALIMRPNIRTEQSPIFKGIDSVDDLEAAFTECMKCSSDQKVWVETDMRAQFNPSRMSVIAKLAEKLAEQLQAQCPNCETPAWGKIGQEYGLICSACGSATEQMKSEIFGCTKCDHQEKKARKDGLEFANPTYCNFCNP